MQDPVEMYYAYSAAWNETADPALRKSLLIQSWAAEGVFVDDENPDGLVGPAALGDYIGRTHAELPGLVVAETSEPQVLGSRLRVRWAALQAGVQTFSGTDFVEFAPDGRVSRVTMFSDDSPEAAG